MNEQAAEPLKVAGVPEAYNDPFEFAKFTQYGITAPIFCSHPGGSGSMLNAVVAGNVDAAFALTDCIIAAIENGSPVRIAAPLIHSPLTWAAIVAPEGVKSVEQLHSATWGVSRIGSGSHTMVQTLAKQKNWAPPKFKVCGNFEGLRSAVREGQVDAFLWEHFTTKPYSDSGEVRIIGGVPTPWGCFSVVVRKDCARVREIRQLVDAFLAAGKEFKASEASVKAISEKYHMTDVDAKAWLDGVHYAEPGERVLDEDTLERTRKTLLDAGVIKHYQCDGGVKAYSL